MNSYVQYGCGLSCPDGWLNFDASPRLRLEQLPFIGFGLQLSNRRLFPSKVRYGDIVKGLPVQDGSAVGVYCSHVLEHIDRQNVMVALRNTHRMLKSGGVFRLVVPDLQWRAQLYLSQAGSVDPFAADDFLNKCHLGKSRPADTTLERLREIFGNSAHRWMYDYALLQTLLADAGFVSIRRCRYGDSEDRMFNAVEEIGRFNDGNFSELAIEARRA